MNNAGNGLIECGGLLERGNLCLVEFLGLAGTPGEACGILARFGEAGIPLAYVSIGNGPRNERNMSFCVDRMDLPASHPLVETVRSDQAPELVLLHEPVTKLTLYGPHFQEKHALVAGVFEALCERGVVAYGIAMSVNSISFVVNSGDRDLAIDCLRQRFSWPE